MIFFKAAKLTAYDQQSSMDWSNLNINVVKTLIQTKISSFSKSKAKKVKNF